jgi:hypothetical protein
MTALSSPPRSFSEREPPPRSMAAAQHRPSRIAAGPAARSSQETFPSSTAAQQSPRKTTRSRKLLLLIAVLTLCHTQQRARKVYPHVFSALRTLYNLSVRSFACVQVSSLFLSWPHALFRKTTGDRGGVSLTAKIPGPGARRRSLGMIELQNFKERVQN